MNTKDLKLSCRFQCSCNNSNFYMNGKKIVKILLKQNLQEQIITLRSRSISAKNKVLLNTKVYIFRIDKKIISKNKLKIYKFIANAQNISNPIGREEYILAVLYFQPQYCTL